jgi:pyruvate dehydrogenase E1 component beta subunit
MAREIEFREALREAMSEIMRENQRVFLMGEEVAEYNGAYKVSKGMLDEFGPRRIIDTPISEGGFAGLGIGAAMMGLRPIIEFMSWSFLARRGGSDSQQRAEDALHVRRAVPVPITFRGNNGAAGNSARPTHGASKRSTPMCRA